MNIMHSYKKLVDKYPYRMQMTAATLTTSIADIIGQSITKELSEKYDLKRTLIMGSFGLLWFGPLATTWYRFAHRKMLSPLRSILTDQLMIAPTIMGGFCFLHPIANGTSVNDSFDKFKIKFLSTITSAWMLWTPAQIINFYFVPYQFRGIYGLCVALVWSTFLSIMFNQPTNERFLTVPSK